MQQGYAESGYQRAMIRAAEVQVAQSETRYVQALLIARLYAFAQQTDLALDWLEKSCALGEPWFAMINVDVDWDSLRDEPRFINLVERIGLEEV